MVAMQRQLLGAEQTAAAQKQTNIALRQLNGSMDLTHNIPPLPRHLNQHWQGPFEPVAAIVEELYAAARQRQRFTGRDEGATGETGS